MNRKELILAHLTAHLLLFAATSALCIVVWGLLLRRLQDYLAVFGPFAWSALGVGAVNAIHLLWGIFHVDDDFSDFSSDQSVWSRPAHEYDRMYVRLISIVTISPSQHLLEILKILRGI